jgi:hypothetical protein
MLLVERRLLLYGVFTAGDAQNLEHLMSAEGCAVPKSEVATVLGFG